ncbi:hypothetical protein IQ266_23160, partial [filamentous cyanobacterium LEGE 11480]|nr:hypothetical protein [Romeriopsis navalis LEGE 11480]
MTYPTQNSGASFAAGANTFLRPFIGNGLLSHHQLYDGLQDTFDRFLPQGAASLDSLSHVGGQTYEASLTIHNYAVKAQVNLSTAIADVYVDFNADNDFADAGEHAIAGLSLAGLYQTKTWQAKVAHDTTPAGGGGTSLAPGMKQEPTGGDTSLTPGVKQEPKGPNHSLNPGSKPEPTMPTDGNPDKPTDGGGGNPGTPIDGGGNPDKPTDGGGNPGTPTDVPPVFVVPQAPTVTSGETGAVIGAVSVTDVDTDVSRYTFSVLDGNGQPDNRFTVENGQLQLDSAVSIDSGSGPVSLIVQVALTNDQGEVTDTFRSDAFTIAVKDDEFTVPPTGGGGGGGGDVPPVFVVPQTPTVLGGQPGAVVGAVSVTDVDTDVSLYTFSVLDANGQPDNRFIVQNGQLQLNPLVSVNAG